MHISSESSTWRILSAHLKLKGDETQSTFFRCIKILDWILIRERLNLGSDANALQGHFKDLKWKSTNTHTRARTHKLLYLLFFTYTENVDSNLCVPSILYFLNKDNILNNFIILQKHYHIEKCLTYCWVHHFYIYVGDDRPWPLNYYYYCTNSDSSTNMSNFYGSFMAEWSAINLLSKMNE